MQDWIDRIGCQRDWVYQGWQVRYCYYRAENERFCPPMILIHGFGASIPHFRHNIPYFGQNYTVYALDLLGFGASRKGNWDYSIDFWTDQVYHFWRTFIQAPVIVIGNSIGSLVALNLAGKYPEMVSHLVMLSLPDLSLQERMIPPILRPFANKMKQLVSKGLSPFIPWIFNFIRQPNFIKKWAGLAYYDLTKVTDELIDILATPPQDQDSAKTFQSLFLRINQKDFSPSVEKTLKLLKIPILLIWGKFDRLVPSQFAQEYEKYNPNLTLILVDRIGHCPHDESPTQFHQIFDHWLSQLTPQVTE